MKNLIWLPCTLPCILLVSACGDEDNAVDVSQAVSEPATAAISAPVNDTPAAQSANLPWDIPTMPNVRVIHAASKFSKTTARRGGESTTLIASKASSAEIVGFYKQALPGHGFEITNSRNLDETSSTLMAKAEDGRTFQIFASHGGSNALTGESSATLVATKPKLAE